MSLHGRRFGYKSDANAVLRFSPFSEASKGSEIGQFSAFSWTQMNLGLGIKARHDLQLVRLKVTLGRLGTHDSGIDRSGSSLSTSTCEHPKDDDERPHFIAPTNFSNR